MEGELAERGEEEWVEAIQEKEGEDVKEKGNTNVNKIVGKLKVQIIDSLTNDTQNNKRKQCNDGKVSKGKQWKS